MNIRNPELAPCGIFCGACPSFQKTCYGCSSEDSRQKRGSKWKCWVRICCYEERKLDYCIYCEEFPCRKIRKKLLANHSGDARYHYRHEVPLFFPHLKTKGVEEYHRELTERWKCPECGGIIHFFTYKCARCGKEMTIEDIGDFL